MWGLSPLLPLKAIINLAALLLLNFSCVTPLVVLFCIGQCAKNFYNSFDKCCIIQIRLYICVTKASIMKPYLIYLSLPHNSKEIYIKDEITDEVLVTIHNNDTELANRIKNLMENKSIEHDRH